MKFNIFVLFLCCFVTLPSMAQPMDLSPHIYTVFVKSEDTIKNRPYQSLIEIYNEYRLECTKQLIEVEKTTGNQVVYNQLKNLCDHMYDVIITLHDQELIAEYETQVNSMIKHGEYSKMAPFSNPEAKCEGSKSKEECQRPSSLSRLGNFIIRSIFAPIQYVLMGRTDL